ncbi:Rieske 2Fe-2S domain-containing protein [Novosphingobium sp. KN65.2]|uniref:aromatic ring-hydroxylating oxygenase subunit alpha n=1 Tax=Novosphingobium sp. KN65.2 TaxID=1478134 RepID=UPI0005E793ED|nr:Rieske 2Fe-2S domain-containing protein [Novosphingobium sp. KN65.2]CDO35244.1 putative 3-phenylpropionate/cinnamic acid dioxygenase subunit alpha [Novosphingobium sp. KN65.2]
MGNGNANGAFDIGKARAAAELVRADKGLVSRKIFADEEIYRMELKQIFGRSWLFLGHESQLPNPGDYITNSMGEDPVIVVRARNGQINAFLNNCRHRGNILCRADAGKAKTFVCPYHGWAYDTDGKLVGVPGIKDYYHDEIDRKEWGLPRVAQVESYRGLIFGNFDADAPPLVEFLGDIRWALDWVLNQGDLQVAQGPVRWTMHGNWKFASDNSGDMYHGPTTHRSGIMAGHKGGAGTFHETKGSDGLAEAMTMFRNEGGFTVIGEYGHGMNANYIDERVLNKQSPLTQWRNDPEVMKKMGPLGARVQRGNIHVFPNLFVNFGSRDLMLRNPLGPDRMEIIKLVLVDKAASPELQRMQVQNSNRHFGPGGVFEQDDGENWDQSTVGCETFMAQQHDLHYAMGMGHGKVIPGDEQQPAHIESLMNEHVQLWLYRNWADFMKAEDWAELRENHARLEEVL